MKQIPEITGWYAWTKIKNENHKIIYIGKSQARKTSNLRSRITEELGDEHVALWASIFRRKEVLETLDKKYKGQYTQEQKRSALKAGSTHIIWVGKEGLKKKELDVIEHKLIEKFEKSNPLVNKQRRVYSNYYPELLDEVTSLLTKEMNNIVVEQMMK